MNLADLQLYAEECTASAIVGRDDLLKLLAIARAAHHVANRNRPPKEVTNDFAALRQSLEGVDL